MSANTAILSSPSLNIPDKAKKYDRQLRLWGDHGQTALEGAKVCLINATATGTEILKNLILPGIGSFTVLDGHKVCGEDVGNNFFLDQSTIGQSRAQVATEFLLELNDDVDGTFVDETVDTLLDNSPTFFNNFSIVVVTDLPERTLLRLAAILWDNDIPLLICKSYALIGYIRLVVKEHTVVESHPDSVFEDLRLDRPFSGFVQYCDSLDLSKMSKKDHSHTPWLAIIYKFLQQWKLQSGKHLPSNYQEKNQLKELIKHGMLLKDDGCEEMEENFVEAVRNVNTALLPTQIPDEVKKIFCDDCCVNLHSESKPFWILAHAVNDFVQMEGQGTLPLRGSIPDMTSDSERYIQLQTVYRDQAAGDLAVVSAHVQQLLQGLGRDEPLTVVKRDSRSPAPSPVSLQDNLTDADIASFCKNSSFLRVVRCRSLAAEYDVSTANVTEIARHLEDTENDHMVYYIMLRAADRFYTEHSRYPGIYTDNVDLDIIAMKTQVTRLMQEWSLTQTIRDEFVHEMCRFGASELHSVAALVGGAAAHEVIKVITHQFVPINNTFIYNALNQTTITVEL